MKKIIILAACFLLFLVFDSQKAFATTVQDQKCTNTPSAYRSASSYLYEIFKPSLSTINRVDFEIWGAGTIRFELRRHSDYALLKTQTLTLSPPSTQKCSDESP